MADTEAAARGVRQRSLLGAMRTVAMVLSPRRIPSAMRNAALWFAAVQDHDALEVWSRHFDPAYYLRTYPDVARSGVDPFVHFLFAGGAERRRPSPSFDLEHYLACNPDVARASVNGLLHYALYGRKERRSIALPVPLPVTVEDGGGILMSTGSSLSPASVVVNNYWPGDVPILSVVIPCFNYGQYIEEALQSILAQTWPGIEILVIEGGSTDGTTREKLRTLEARRMPNVTFYYREGRHLVGDNRNYGIGLARGRYVCCLDADDLLSPIYLEVALFIAEGYGYDVVYTSSQCFGDSDIRWMLTDASFPEIAQDNQISTTAVFRRSSWAEAGGIRDWGLGAFHVPEDWEFWVRLLGRGGRAKSISEPLFQYRVHQKGLTGTTILGRAQQRNAISEANAELVGKHSASPEKPLTVLHRWDNLFKGIDDEGPPGFVLALPFVTIGGAETLIYGIAREICRQGFRLIVITSLALPDTVPDRWKSLNSLTPHVYPLAGLFHDAGWPEEFVCYLIRRYRVTNLFFAGCELVYHLLPRLAMEFPELHVTDQLFNDQVHAPNNRRYRKHIDATVVPSEALKHSLLMRTPDDPGHIPVIPHAVHIPEPEVRSARTLRNELGWPSDKIVVGFFGRWSEEKGADVFLEIARRLSDDDSWFFVMTGEGPERERLMAKIQQYRLTPAFVRSRVRSGCRAVNECSGRGCRSFYAGWYAAGCT